jgi:hypothetical protein
MITDNTSVRPSSPSSASSASSSAPAAVTVNSFRQPAAFAAPNPPTSEPSCPTFYYYKDKTKTPMIHPATGVSTDGGMSMPVFRVEGSGVNTPELSAGGRGGGLSQGLPANGAYKSLFRVGSRSESCASARNHHKTDAATTAAAPRASCFTCPC